MMAIGYGLHKGIVDNYLAEIVEMGEFGRGVAEFFRELPGFMLVFILALLYRFSAESIFKIGGLIMLVGMILQTGLPADRVLVTTAICIYSLGEHIQLGMRNTLSLEYSQEGKGGRALGFQNSIYQGGTLAGFIIVMIAFTFIGGERSFRLFFAISALIMGIGTVLAFRMNGDSKTDKAKSKFYFRKKYTKFYILEVFYGARKQIFFTFGPYVLILFYKASTSNMLLFCRAGHRQNHRQAGLQDRHDFRHVDPCHRLLLLWICPQDLPDARCIHHLLHQLHPGLRNITCINGKQCLRAGHFRFQGRSQGNHQHRHFCKPLYHNPYCPLWWLDLADPWP